MKLLVVTSALLVISTAAYSCSKDWIKIMVMNVCSVSKRHIANENQYKQWTMHEIDSQFSRMYGDLDADDENLWKIDESRVSIERKEDEGKGRRNRMKRASMLNERHFNLGVLESYLGGHDNLEEHQAKMKQKIKREIRALIEKCCKQQVCTVDDFRGICN